MVLPNGEDAGVHASGRVGLVVRRFLVEESVVVESTGRVADAGAVRCTAEGGEHDSEEEEGDPTGVQAPPG